MSILYSPESAFAKESVKWEALPSTMGPGLRPYVRRDYPTWIFRAARSQGDSFEFETLQVEDEQQAANWFSRGYHPDPLLAIKGLKAQELEDSKLAAERHFQERRMSPQAQAEGAAADAASFNHLPSVPETPIKRRGRPKKASVA